MLRKWNCWFIPRADTGGAGTTLVSPPCVTALTLAHHREHKQLCLCSWGAAGWHESRFLHDGVVPVWLCRQGIVCAEFLPAPAQAREAELCHEEKPQHPAVQRHKKWCLFSGIRKKEAFSGCTTSLTGASCPESEEQVTHWCGKSSRQVLLLWTCWTEGKIGVFGFNAEASIVWNKLLYTFEGLGLWQELRNRKLMVWFFMCHDKQHSMVSPLPETQGRCDDFSLCGGNIHCFHFWLSGTKHDYQMLGAVPMELEWDFPEGRLPCWPLPSLLLEQPFSPWAVP